MCPVSTDYAMGQAWPMALGTLRNAEKPPFPAFPAFPAFLRDSGGPSLPSGQGSTERRKVARMATLRLFASWEYPWYPWIQTSKGGLEALLLAA